MHINKSIAMAIILVVIAIAWIISGQIFNIRTTITHHDDKISDSFTNTLMRVGISKTSASAFIPSIIISGHTEAARIITLKAETAGRVVATPISKGSKVLKGAEIVHIDVSDRNALMDKANSRISHRQIEYNVTSNLVAKGFKAKTALVAIKAELDAAKSERRTIEIDLERTRVRAPIRGVLNDLMVGVGDYLTVGDAVAKIIDLNPLLVVAQISERQAALIEIGMSARVHLSTGAKLTGIVSYISNVADEKTRTFRIEINVDNPASKFGHGFTAEINIDLPSKNSHRISPSIFRREKLGQLGVMIVDKNNQAHFIPITIIGTDDKGTWVSGLPNNTRVIVVGQDMVKEGEIVEPVETSNGTIS
ncbi:efflux transporter, RND family, MFP subunit [Candidatus Endolissoclinum faulkneri L5]|uniref:Efflux transporter, RND family, MFP subunit n=1 Tax=Candidatus Endolissoclinum faulkneri L5 TaxID=1401328 RepID=V9TWW4_9PROT|nr:efflux RND transporter periplasmic adaptor subunit [Candidatus Endolissoclinum faulkneri]AHC73810.1 efflux transporter, RND family, MFP subunit [Candidatus Endolissoclinum faulkneri L5]